VRLGWLALACALGSALVGCAALPTLTERPEEYSLFRAARAAPTLEERLTAAHRYLREVPGGRHTVELRRWFEQTEERYYLSAFNRLPNLYAYRQALPTGPHIEDVRARITWLEGRSKRREQHETAEDRRIAASLARVSEADAKRRAFVTTFKDWTTRLLGIKSFGEPTSELSDETIFAFRLSPPAGGCRGDSCKKLLELSYEVPGDRELVPRAALLEVQLELSQGLLSRARLAGPELWTRLAEALSLRPLPTPTPEERADAIYRSSQLVRALLETSMPSASCEVAAQAPVVLERKCGGLWARMLAAPTSTEDDSIEIAPAPP
jgi:hypothetical protein